jgi:hypothetical protein
MRALHAAMSEEVDVVAVALRLACDRLANNDSQAAERLFVELVHEAERLCDPNRPPEG